MPLKPRIIPVLLLHKGGLYKTKQFKNPIYVGDPINAVRIFNEKQVDELMILDIDCSVNNSEPNYELIEEIVSEAFIPVAYGGGISSLAIAENLFQLGIEKVVLNTVLKHNTQIIKEIGDIYGAQAIVACIDFKKNFFGKTNVYFNSGTNKVDRDIGQLAKIYEVAGAGELLLNDIDNEGMYSGYNQSMLKEIVTKVQIPVVISGGACQVSDFTEAAQNGASGMAAGSMFIYQRPHNAVLISYPSNYFYS
ncbi:MAG: imidazole glycerol phosphate synthase subunit HisF [Bacteroidota bacterium]|jgi:cyclase